VELISDLPQHIAAHWILIPIRAEETHNPPRLLEGLDEAVEQNPVKGQSSDSRIECYLGGARRKRS
jgi:hypothetical protein